ncbi:MAG: hypothetical protein ACKVOK_00420, partial [Flavobacteriales bacterium]
MCDNLELNPQAFNIYGNGAGCNTGDEILASCGDSYVEGEVFYDLDCDGIFNNADVYVNHPVILNELNLPVGNSNFNGHYFVPLQDNSSTTLSVGDMPGYSANAPTFTTGVLPVAYNDIQFALCPQADLHDLTVSAIFSPFRPGFSTGFYIQIQNQGPQAEDAIVSMDLSGMTGVSFVSGSPGVTQSGSVLTWNVQDIPALNHSYVWALLHLDASILVGTLITSVVDVEITPASLLDINPADNELITSVAVVGSYDPNDITVNIEAQNFAELPTEGLSLDYTIRFQNTGTAPAEFVRVTDIIEEDLNLGSIEILGSSHEFQLSFNENREVEWLFENIQLPDSASDLEGSQGYIHYRIKTNPDVMIDDVIENTAAIYFDYNEPVITNTATTDFYECPEELAITTEGTYCEGESISVLATYGWDEYSWTVNDQTDGTGLGISIDNAPPGIYFISVESTTAYCTATAGYEFFVEESPNDVVITGDQEICEGENIVLTATSEWDNYSWIQNGNEVSTTNEVEITSPTTGNYVIQLLTTNVNCTSTMDVSFTVFANPVVIIDYINQIITGPEGYTYAWYLNGQLVEGETTNTFDPWQYVVDGMMAYAIVTNENGCSAQTNTL